MIVTYLLLVSDKLGKGVNGATLARVKYIFVRWVEIKII